MIRILACHVRITPPDSDGDRELLAWVELDNGSGQPLEGLGLRLELVGQDGAVLLETELDENFCGLGRQVVALSTYVRLGVPVVRARWRFQARHGAWSGPVQALGGDALARSTPLDARPQSPPPVVTAPPGTPVPAGPLAASGGPVPPPPGSPAAPAAPSRQRPHASPLPAPVRPTPPPTDVVDKWALVEAGDWEGARPFFEGVGLDMHGRDRVRDLIRGPDPVGLAIGCRIAGITGWKSSVQNMRRLVRHPEADVRCAAAEAIGVLAGPAMEPTLRPLLDDPDERVRGAALQAIARLEGR